MSLNSDKQVFTNKNIVRNSMSEHIQHLYALNKPYSITEGVENNIVDRLLGRAQHLNKIGCYKSAKLLIEGAEEILSLKQDKKRLEYDIEAP